MKTNDGVLFPVKLLLGITICFLVLVAGYCASTAQPTRNASIATLHSGAANSMLTPVAMPSLLMEGKGQITQFSSRCISASCAGIFTATLRGRPFGKADLTLNLSVNPATNAFTGCNQVTGTGAINDNAYTVNLVGQLCAPGIGYTLSGTVQIYSVAAASGTAAIGTLLAFGGTNLPPNPVPNSGPNLISLIGASGKIPLLLP